MCYKQSHADATRIRSNNAFACLHYSLSRHDTLLVPLMFIMLLYDGNKHPSGSTTACWNSPAGSTLIRITSNHPIFIELHDYQLDRICMSLYGHDVLATMATSHFSCSSSVLYPRIPVSQLARAYSRRAREDPAIVICPTKAFQTDIKQIWYVPFTD